MVDRLAVGAQFQVGSQFENFVEAGLLVFNLPVVLKFFLYLFVVNIVSKEIRAVEADAAEHFLDIINQIAVVHRFG